MRFLMVGGVKKRESVDNQVFTLKIARVNF